MIYAMVNMSHTALQDEVISAFEYYAGLAEDLDRTGDEDLHVPDENMQITVRREPLGVCALITPWNVSACKQFLVSTASHKQIRAAEPFLSHAFSFQSSRFVKGAYAVVCGACHSGTSSLSYQAVGGVRSKPGDLRRDGEGF